MYSNCATRSLHLFDGDLMTVGTQQQNQEHSAGPGQTVLQLISHGRVGKYYASPVPVYAFAYQKDQATAYFVTPEYNSDTRQPTGRADIWTAQ